MAATIEEYLQSIVGDEITLPDNLLPDDTTLIYDDNGNPICEMDLDDVDEDTLQDRRDHKRYVSLALTHYNRIHDTDYKFVKRMSLTRYLNGDDITLVHCGFTAAPGGGRDAAPKHFCSDFDPDTDGLVSCCCVVDVKTTGCDMCGIFPCEEISKFPPELDFPKCWKADVPPLSEYAHHLAEGVTLSDKAKIRVRHPLLALAYYNNKHHADHKLVDALFSCVSLEHPLEIVAHCNFIARQSASAGAPNKLFFAELVNTNNGWVVTACRVVRGKTTAGCYNCPSHRGRRVIHPTHGFRFGLYPGGDGPHLRRR